MLITDPLIYKGFVHFALQKIVAKGDIYIAARQSHLTTVVSNFNWSRGTEIEDVFTGNHKKKKIQGTRMKN